MSLSPCALLDFTPTAHWVQFPEQPVVQPDHSLSLSQYIPHSSCSPCLASEPSPMCVLSEPHASPSSSPADPVLSHRLLNRALSWGPVPPANPKADFNQKSKSCLKHLLLRKAFPGQSTHHPPSLITSCGSCLHIFLSIPIICHMCTYKISSTKTAGNKNSGLHVTEKTQSARHSSKHFSSHNHPIKQGRV